jgi:transcriptional regulator with XRE-family HTH domain
VNATDRALARIQQAMKEHRISQRALAERLDCSQGRVAKILKGRIRLTVDDLETIAALVQLPLVETIRNRGVEFFAELTPSELKMLEAVRESPPLQRALSDLLDASRIAARLSDKRQLKRMSTSGKTPSFPRGFPDGGAGHISPSALADLRRLATDLSIQLAAFATGGSQSPAIRTVKDDKP